jgi:hypothetical protein
MSMLEEVGGGLRGRAGARKARGDVSIILKRGREVDERLEEGDERAGDQDGR